MLYGKARTLTGDESILVNLRMTYLVALESVKIGLFSHVKKFFGPACPAKLLKFTHFADVCCYVEKAVSILEI